MKYDKIKARIKELDLKVQEVAEMINIPSSRLSETIGGKREIQANEILPLSEILKVDPVSLLKYLTNRSDELSFTEGKATSKIPVLGSVEAGIWRESNVLQGNGDAIDYPLPSGYDAKYIFALRVDGESMNKVLPNGTYIVCVHINACPAIDDGDYVVAQRNKSGLYETTVKRLITKDDGTRWLLPESTDPKFTPIPMNTGDEIQIIAKAIATYRKL